LNVCADGVVTIPLKLKSVVEPVGTLVKFNPLPDREQFWPTAGAAAHCADENMPAKMLVRLNVKPLIVMKLGTAKAPEPTVTFETVPGVAGGMMAKMPLEFPEAIDVEENKTFTGPTPEATVVPEPLKFPTMISARAAFGASKNATAAT
jgi:hypothetical protein